MQPDPKVLETLPISMWPWPRIVVLVPQERNMPETSTLFYTYWGIAAQSIPIFEFPYARTDIVRNRAGFELLRSNYTHVLMLDMDHNHPRNVVQQLARWVIKNPEFRVVSGINFRRGEPFDPCCSIKGEDDCLHAPAEWDQGLMQMNAVGGGSLLIEKSVFAQLRPPWFWYDYEDWWYSDVWPSEDMGFSALCYQAGIPMYVDTSTSSPHLRSDWVTEQTFREYIVEHKAKILKVRK